MQRNLRCLYVKENSLPEEVVIPNTLKAKQEKVEGFIKYAYLSFDDNVAIICNEEGLINGMGPNRYTGDNIIFGPFLIVGETSEDGEDRSLTDEQIIRYKDYFNEDSIEVTQQKILEIIMSKKCDIDL